MTTNLIAIDQRPKPFTRPWLLAWGIKAYQLLCGYPWSSARFNHVGILSESTVIELDMGMCSYPVDQLSYEFERCLELDGINGNQLWVDAIYEANLNPYNVYFNAIHLPLVGKYLKPRPHNCVSFACMLLGLPTEFWGRMPCEFVKESK